MDTDAKHTEDLVARVREMFQGTVMARPKRLRPGSSFKNGKLYVFSDRLTLCVHSQYIAATNKIWNIH